jgi:hypothetical protein
VSAQRLFGASESSALVVAVNFPPFFLSNSFFSFYVHKLSPRYLFDFNELIEHGDTGSVVPTKIETFRICTTFVIVDGMY